MSFFLSGVSRADEWLGSGSGSASISISRSASNGGSASSSVSMRSRSICGVVRPSGRSGESSANRLWICSSVSSGTSSGRRFGPVGVEERNSRVTDSGRSSVTLWRFRFSGVKSFGSSGGMPRMVADEPGLIGGGEPPAGAAGPSADQRGANVLVACDCSSAS